MCGYCTERIPIEIAEYQALGKLEELQEREDRRYTDPMSSYCLQEYVGPAKFFQDHEEYLWEDTKFYNEYFDEFVTMPDRTIIFCRIIEIFIREGFQSEVYQYLLRNKALLPFVEYECKRNPVCGNLIAPGSALMGLFKAEQFFIEGVWEEITQLPTLVDSCIELLRAYADQHHLKPDFSGQPLESSVFSEILPYVFFSMMVVAKYNPQHDSVLGLIRTNPPPPLFDALDLWLQRRAALLIHEGTGLEPFLPFGKAARPVLLYYLLITHRLTADEREILKEAILEDEDRIPDDRLPQNRSPFYMYMHSIILDYLAEYPAS
ncbi:MAG: hypothetical protein H0T73_10210 [Ardenticatenales bacterium]|nr:hypothetical protein [Ardenticatenales bacterium]